VNVLCNLLCNLLRSLARVGLIAVGALALAAACAPAKPKVLAAVHEPVALVPARLAAKPTPTMASPHTELGELIESGPKSVGARERLNVDLLRRFYARHGYAPVWTTHEAQANALTKAVMRAGEHGLAPELFQANLLRTPSTLPALDRELLLSNAFLTYADALAHGVMPIERRRDDEVLAPEPIDVALELDIAIDSPDPAAVIEALAPSTPTYKLLRQALQNVHAGRPVAGKAAVIHAREIEVNLERQRWLPRRLPADRVWVNAADARLAMYRDDRPVFSTKVIVGQDDKRNQSPEFQASIDAIFFNPPWNIPKDIVTEEILPLTRKDPKYLEEHHMVLLPDGGVQQAAGATSGLGFLLFEMTNRFDVYLHDTPSKDLFLREDRRISHGCIRVEDPKKLAALLMKQSTDAIDKAIATGHTTRRNLPESVPVFVVYETAFADADGKLQFRADVYKRDAEISQYLASKSQPVPEREAPKAAPKPTPKPRGR
jgi:murein L,D-transpeptidase YcbB/YkuD